MRLFCWTVSFLCATKVGQFHLTRRKSGISPLTRQKSGLISFERDKSRALNRTSNDSRVYTATPSKCTDCERESVCEATNIPVFAKILALSTGQKTSHPPISPYTHPPAHPPQNPPPAPTTIQKFRLPRARRILMLGTHNIKKETFQSDNATTHPTPAHPLTNAHCHSSHR